MGKFIGQVGLQYLWGKIKYYFVTALGTSGNYLTWTKNGTTNNITVPFATTSSKVGTSTVGSYQKPVYINSGTPTAVSGVNERYVTKGYLSDEGYIATDLVPSLLPLIDTTAGNKLALLPPSQVIIEQTTDGGTTWVNAGVSDSAKKTLFLGTDSNATINIPLLNGVKNKLCGIRVTITGMKYNVPEGTTETNKYQYWNKNYLNKTERYVSLSGVYIWLSSNSDRIRTRVFCATGNNPDTWVSADNGNNAYLQGWTGGNYIFLKDLVFGGNTNQPQNYWNYRLEFFTDGANGGNLSTSSTTSAQYVCRICGYGRNGWVLPNNLMKLNHLYTWDTELTMITKSVRPDTNNTHSLGNSSYKWANVYATTFYGSLDGNASTATKATQDASGNVITSTYAPKASPALTGTPTAPTAAAGTNTTQIATTAFVKAALDDRINTLEEGVLEDEEIVAASLVDLNNRLDTVLLDLEDDEQAIAGALTDLNNLADVATSGSYNDLDDKPTIPTTLASLTGDSTHRLVTDAEKSTWNSKGTYSKPSGGIPASDLANGVIPTNISAFNNDIGYLIYHLDISGKQDTLISGTNIKTFNGESVLGSGNISIPTKTSDLTNDSNFTNKNYVDSAIENNLVPNALAYIDGNVGTPIVNVTKSGNTITFAFLNLKGEKGEPGLKGDTTIIDGASTYDLYNSTGANTNGAMTLKAVTDALNELQIDEIHHTALEISVTIAPNNLHIWDSPMPSLNITFGGAVSGRVNEYMIRFTVPSNTESAVSFYPSVRWVEEPDWNTGSTYEISVINGLAIYAEWEEEI